jgi:hypothetical protein
MSPGEVLVLLFTTPRVGLNVVVVAPGVVKVVPGAVKLNIGLNVVEPVGAVVGVVVVVCPNGLKTEAVVVVVCCVFVSPRGRNVAGAVGACPALLLGVFPKLKRNGVVVVGYYPPPPLKLNWGVVLPPGLKVGVVVVVGALN